MGLLAPLGIGMHAEEQCSDKAVCEFHLLSLLHFQL